MKTLNDKLADALRAQWRALRDAADTAADDARDYSSGRYDSHDLADIADKARETAEELEDFEREHGLGGTDDPPCPRDEWQIWSDYGYGWEEECAEDTRAEGLARLREYRENGGGAYQLRKRRVRLDSAAVQP